MKNKCKEYAEMIRNDINSLYEGKTVDECESLFDYIANALDVEYTLNSQRELIGVRVYVTLGGPTCWIDTRNGEVVCAWGTDKESVWLASEVCEEINSYFEDFLNFSIREASSPSLNAAAAGDKPGQMQSQGKI